MSRKAATAPFRSPRRERCPAIKVTIWLALQCSPILSNSTAATRACSSADCESPAVSAAMERTAWPAALTHGVAWSRVISTSGVIAAVSPASRADLHAITARGG